MEVNPANKPADIIDECTTIYFDALKTRHNSYRAMKKTVRPIVRQHGVHRSWRRHKTVVD